MEISLGIIIKIFLLTYNFINIQKSQNMIKKIVPSGVEPLSRDPESHMIATTPRD